MRQGDIVAVICDIFGQSEEADRTPIDGKIIGHATLPIVNQGDAILHIAEIVILEETGGEGAVSRASTDKSDIGLNRAMLDEDEVI